MTKENSVFIPPTINDMMYEAAHNFLYTHAKFCMWDDGDDAHEQDKWADTFDWLNAKLPAKERAPSLVEYIKGYMPEEIQKAKDEACDGEEWSPSCSQFLDEEME